MAEIIARDVLAIVGKFQAGSASPRTTLGAELAGEQALLNNVQVFEFLEELVVEQRKVGACSRHISWRIDS
jgi:hypothetical protein